MRFILILLIMFLGVGIFANDNEDSAPSGGSPVQEKKNLDNEEMLPETDRNSVKKYKKKKKKYKKKKYSAKKLYKLGRKKKAKRKYKKAIYYYKRSCKLNYAEACYTLAKVYMYGHFKVKKNEEEGLKYYKKACKSGIKHACNKKSKAEKKKEREERILARNIKRENALKEKKIKLEKSCEAERTTSCRSLAYMHYRSKDYENSKKFFKKACDLDDSISCSNLGLIYLEKDEDFKNAERYIRKSCNLGNKHGCNMASYLKDYKKCNKNNALSCHNLAKAYAKGDVFSRNIKYAYKFYIKACNLKNAESCKIIADDYSRGFKNRKEAKVFYKKACEAGDKYSCKTVIFLKYDSECKLEIGISCDKLAQMYDNGIGIKKSIRIANMFYQKACKLGYKKACDK